MRGLQLAGALYATREKSSRWHEENFGPQERFGYKDFIPLFRAEKFDPDAWALLFKRAGTRFVMPAAQHHDNFAMWASDLTPFNAAKMGPRRDLIGELGRAVRGRGMRYGLSKGFLTVQLPIRNSPPRGRRRPRARFCHLIASAKSPASA